MSFDVNITDDDVQEYINKLPWSEHATETEKQLVNCNILSFFRWLKEEGDRLPWE